MDKKTAKKIDEMYELYRGVKWGLTGVAIAVPILIVLSLIILIFQSL